MKQSRIKRLKNENRQGNRQPGRLMCSGGAVCFPDLVSPENDSMIPSTMRHPERMEESHKLSPGELALRPVSLIEMPHLVAEKRQK